MVFCTVLCTKFGIIPQPEMELTKIFDHNLKSTEEIRRPQKMSLQC